MKCTKCGGYVYSADSFCRSCGTSLENNQCKYGDNISNSAYDSSSCHEKQYDYSYNYSNPSKPSYDINANHADQFNYSYNYSFDPSKYDYALPKKQSGDDKYIEAYVGQNYAKIKEGKFSIPGLLFGVYYLLYRKVWGYALLCIVITFAAKYLLDESLASLVSIVINFIIGYKFNQIYMKQAENKVEKIKQENLDKTTNELLAICRKKGGASISGLITASIVFFFTAFIIAIIFYSVNYINNENNNTNYEVTEEKSQSIPSLFSYTIPQEFELIYEAEHYKSYQYKDESSSTYCYIAIDSNASTTYETEEIYIEKHLISNNPDEQISSPAPITYNNRTWKYSHLESSRRSETLYVTRENNKYFVIKTYDYKYNNQTNDICNSKYNEFMNTVKINN